MKLTVYLEDISSSSNAVFVRHIAVEKTLVSRVHISYDKCVIGKDLYGKKPHYFTYCHSKVGDLNF